MQLKSSPKLADGRSVEPSITVERLQAALGARYEYLMHEEKVTDDLFWSTLFVEGTEFRAMGKGTSAVLSRAGALAEAAEWLLCRDTANLPGYVAAHQDDLPPGSFLPLGDLLSHVATATPPVLDKIKNLDEAQHWVDGYSLTGERKIKVPIEYVDLISGPNGKAAGNTLEEAIEHAILEIFERRAHITVLRNRLIMPTIDPASIKDPVILRQMDFFRDKGIEVVIKDLSFGHVLPCAGTYFADRNIADDYQFHHFFKVGASFNGIEALTRTFTEFSQGRTLDEYIEGGKAEQERVLGHDFRALPVCDQADDNYLSSFMFGFVPWRETDFLGQGPVKDFQPGTGYRDSRQDILHACSICRQLGKELIVVDYSQPGVDFAVVRVIVPGYSDVLPFHPAASPGLFTRLKRSEVLAMYHPAVHPGEDQA